MIAAREGHKKARVVSASDICNASDPFPTTEGFASWSMVFYQLCGVTAFFFVKTLAWKVISQKVSTNGESLNTLTALNPVYFCWMKYFYPRLHSASRAWNQPLVDYNVRSETSDPPAVAFSCCLFRHFTDSWRFGCVDHYKRVCQGFNSWMPEAIILFGGLLFFQVGWASFNCKPPNSLIYRIYGGRWGIDRGRSWSLLAERGWSDSCWPGTDGDQGGSWWV